MNNTLTIFDFEDNAVRVIDQDGLPWFVASDVCRVLDISNSRDAVSDLDDDEKTVASSNVATTDVKIPNRGLTIISESGLYALIFKSRKEEAKKFRKWITSEVIPAIRKTGKYEIAPEFAEQPVENEWDDFRDRLDHQAAHVADMMREVMELSRVGSFPQERSRVICALGGRALEAMRFRLDLHNAGNTKHLPPSA